MFKKPNLQIIELNITLFGLLNNIDITYRNVPVS